MQNKGLIRFLAWAFALVCLFQLSFTFATTSVQRKAKKAAETYISTEQAKQFVANRTLTTKPMRKFISALPIASARLVKSTLVLT